MNQLIKELVEAFGPSGFEDEVRDIVRGHIAAHVDGMEVDSLGNLIAHREGTGEGLRVMVAAHLDEIGLMVNHVTENGFLYFTNIGGIYPLTLQGSRVRFANGTVGVIHSEPVESVTRTYGLDRHFIDVGASSRDDCPVGTGDVAIFDRPFATQGTRLIGKSMDDRLGCALLVETIRRLEGSPHQLYFVFSVQEEVGTRGAMAAANRLEPDVGLAIDLTRTGDTPEAKKMAVSLGKGPAIKVKDSGMIAHTGLVRQMRRTAEEAGLPYQMEVLTSGSTDARSMQIAGPGAAAGCLSIPGRYIHTQSEMVDAADVENGVQLLVALLSGPLDLT